jgi:uncharacterized RDD family membrane protein YckC
VDAGFFYKVIDMANVAFAKFEGAEIGYRITRVCQYKGEPASTWKPIFVRPLGELMFAVDDDVKVSAGQFCNPRKLLGV